MTDKEKLTALIDHFGGGNQQRFASLIGLSRSNVATWIHRGNITAAGREAILDAFPQVSREWLQGINDTDMMVDEDDTIRFDRDELTPFYSECSATCGIAEQFAHPELATEHMRLPGGLKALAALPAEGDSMEPTIRPGDICIIGDEISLLNVSPHAIYLIITRQGHCMFKRIYDEGRTAPKILALSDNPDYYPHAEPFIKTDILHIYPLKYVLHKM